MTDRVDLPRCWRENRWPKHRFLTQRTILPPTGIDPNQEFLQRDIDVDVGSCIPLQ